LRRVSGTNTPKPRPAVWISHLVLTHYRTYTALSLPLGPGLLALTGPNGVGKTNVLEALHTLCLTKGFGADRDALQHHAPAALIEARVDGLPEDDLGRTHHRVSLSLSPGKAKRVLWDGEALPKLAAHVGRLPVVCVLPSHTDLISSGASERRRWLDGLLSQTDPHYLLALMRYEQALAQRNALLKAFAEHRTPWAPDQLLPWTEQLVAHGVYLQQARTAFLLHFAPRASAEYAHLAGPEAEAVGIVHQPNLPAAAPDAPPGQLAEAFRAALEAGLVRDRAVGRTLSGPHRDDLLFTLSGQPLRPFGSQGQQKSFILALKLAQYDDLRTRAGHPPLLLLDDVLDRLDAHRARRLIARLAQLQPRQVVVTDTSADRLRAFFTPTTALPLHIYTVQPGAVQQQA